METATSPDETHNLNSSEYVGESDVAPKGAEDKCNDEAKKVDDSEGNDTDNPYAYLVRGGFTSEKFKIEIRNLPKYYGLRELKKLLNKKLKLDTNKIKPGSKGSHWLYVCFKCEEDKQRAINVLNGYKWKGSELRAGNAQAVPDPLVKKRLLDRQESDLIDSKKIKMDDLSETDKLKDAITHLWRLPYEEQLKEKEKMIHGILKSFGKQLMKVNPSVASMIKSQTMNHNGLPCEVWPIRHAEPSDGYRNKCEFTIGINEAGVKTVGFRLGSYADGSVTVASIEDVLHVPNRMKEVVSVFQEYVRRSNLDVFQPETHEGYWRQLTVRYGFRTNQLMLIVGIHPQNKTEIEIQAVMDNIKTFFSDGDGKLCNVTSLYLQIINKKKSNEDESIYKHISGDTCIYEKLLDCLFRISPQAFFQINTSATEMLYNSIAELAQLDKDVSLLDVCCGTGSIGICLANKCAEVLGLEISPEAVADAKENAVANNINNAQFFTGKAEEILSGVAFKASKDNVVAIVDPPRAGLQHNALVQLRKCHHINKLVYVSCDPKLALKNFVDLGRPPSKTYQKEPFLPVKAVPVDMFPNTKHCELLIYFERQVEKT